MLFEAEQMEPKILLYMWAIFLDILEWYLTMFELKF